MMLVAWSASARCARRLHRERLAIRGPQHNNVMLKTEFETCMAELGTKDPCVYRLPTEEPLTTGFSVDPFSGSKSAAGGTAMRA